MSSPTKVNLCEILTKGNQNVPPIYSELKWQQPEISEYETPLGGGVSPKPLTGCLLKSYKIDRESAEKVRWYYQERLTQNGWKSTLDADEVVGGTFTETYENKGWHFVVRYLLIPESKTPGILNIFYSDQ